MSASGETGDGGGNGHDHDHDHDHDHGHDHDHDHDHGDEFSPEVVTGAIYEARTGLRSNVQDLMDVLSVVDLFVPLAEDIEGAPEGEQIEIDGSLTFRPHMLVHEDGNVFAVAYSEPFLVETIQASLDWQTSGGDLKFVQLPARVALDLGQSQIENVQVRGVVLNAGDDSELVLLRDELASLLQGKALPLVGYVEHLGEGVEDDTQVIEGADPPPAALLEALTAAVAREGEIASFDVMTTYNPERDREPHLSIILTLTTPEVDREALAERVMDEAAPHLPAPGYADVVFRGPPN